MADLPFRGGQPLETVANTPYGHLDWKQMTKAPALKDGAVTHQLVGRVKAYQGKDG